MRRLTSYLLTLSIFLSISLSLHAGEMDSIRSGFSMSPQWHVGAEVNPASVFPTNDFLKGINPLDKDIRWNLSGAVRAGFSFNPRSREGILYNNLYQGVGIGAETFYNHPLLGSPFTAYLFQGMPFARLSSRLSLGYEWKFGAAFGWKHYVKDLAEDNACVSTSVTALMSLDLKLNYSLSDRWLLSLGFEAQHFSNGNTSLPNAGINTIGASIGITYIINPISNPTGYYRDLEEEADRGRWMYDIVAYGAWRKRIVCIGDPVEPHLAPGKFGVAGLQFSPLRSLNRYVAVGPALDLQWDESAGLDSNWVEGTMADDMKFYRPGFGKQVSAGISAHAELTMPIFSVNVGLGYDFINPEGNNRFFQSLTLKTFISRHIFLNVGYRLGRFQNPQNLMLGIGVRL